MNYKMPALLFNCGYLNKVYFVVLANCKIFKAALDVIWSSHITDL